MFRIVPDVISRAIRQVQERRRAVDAQRASGDVARSILDGMNIEIAVIDEAGIIVSTNKSWDDFAHANGMPDGYGAGSNYLEVCDAAIGSSCEGASAVAAGIRGVIRGEVPEFEWDYPCHSPQEERWFKLRATRLADAGPIRAVIAHRNITQQKKLRALEVERSVLKNAMSGMEQVLGVVGHELRTPLAALHAMVEYMLSPESKGTPQAEKFLPMIHSEVSRMSDTVDNLLEAARLDSGRARWNWQRFTLASIFDEVIENCRLLVDDNRVTLRQELCPRSLQMWGDEGAVRRLLLNFISNARKNTTSGTIELIGRSFMEGDHRWIELQVRDSGRGIDPSIASRLGEAFALNSGVVGANCVQGTGLGLAICKGIAAAHGGRLAVHSVLGRGTTISALLRADLASAETTDRQVPILKVCTQPVQGAEAA
jgi:signal transduction histidine kinase